MSIIGIDLGGTKVAGAVFTEDGTIIRQNTLAIAGRTGKDVGQLILSMICSLLPNNKNEMIAIGVCVPGIANSKTSRVWAPNIPGWEDYPLQSELEEFINDKIIITIESDRTCYILGEVWKGAAMGCTNAIYLSVGTGIGAGILIDGRILHGADDIVGATGWMALQSPFNSNYVSCGCFEYFASGRGIMENAKRLLKSSSNHKGYLKSKMIEAISTQDVFEAYKKGDSIAIQVINKAIEMWGMATANLVSLFNPEKIIFGGGVFGPASEYLDDIITEARKWAQPVSMKNVTVESSLLEGNAGIYGAACMAMNFNKYNIPA